LSKEHASQVKDQGRCHCCHNKHKKFPYRPTHDASLLSGHAKRFQILNFPNERKLMKKRADDENVGHFVSCKRVFETSGENIFA
jgi:hypothetical protein